MKIITIIFRECELAIRHDPANGFTAGARGPFGVAVLALIIVSLAIIFGR